MPRQSQHLSATHDPFIYSVSRLHSPSVFSNFGLTPLPQVVELEKILPSKQKKKSASQMKLDKAHAAVSQLEEQVQGLEGQLDEVEANYDEAVGLLREVAAAEGGVINKDLLERVKSVVTTADKEGGGVDGEEEEEDEDEEEDEHEDEGRGG